MIVKIQTPTGEALISCHDTDKSVLPQMQTTGQYENHIQSLFSTMVKPGFTVLDIGANYGQHTVVLSKLAGEAGRVIAIEASESNFKHLCETSKLNNLKNATLLNLGLWSKIDTLTFCHMDDNAGCNFFCTTDYGLSHHGDCLYQMEVVPLDIFYFKPDFVKIDIEGAELHALKGATKTLSHNPPLLIELNSFTCSSFIGIQIEEIIDYITDILKYDIIRIFDSRNNSWNRITRAMLKMAFISGAVLVDTLFMKEEYERTNS
jgi:FkbM family methyltransferase